MKFSIIIPVYNTEKYLKKCIDSVIKQTYKNFELIIVNDGSTDNSEELIKKTIKNHKNCFYFYKNNGGLSSARNYGLTCIKGDFILFLDSDDYYNENLLLKLNDFLIKHNNTDLLRFQCSLVDSNSNILSKIKYHEFTNLLGEESFKYFVEEDLFEPACIYAYNRVFWENNSFKFSEGKVHEDFALIPRIILMAQKVSSISFFGYNYVQTPNSIIHNKNREKVKKRVYDMVYHCDNLFEFINSYDCKLDNTKKLFESFLANSLIQKSRELEGEDLKKYIEELKKRNLSQYLIDDSLKRKIKKAIIKLNLGLYIKIFNK